MHLRETRPRARMDDYWETQWRKVIFIRDLQQKYECDVVHSGDLFDKPKPSPYLLTYAFNFLPEHFWTIYGQHDLPNHNINLSDKSGINTLSTPNHKVHILPMGHWGTDPAEQIHGAWTIRNRRVFVWHHLTYKDTKPFPKHVGPSAFRILKKLGTELDLDLIVTGDNHIPFVEELDGRLLVNPGSMMRMDADQIDHKPRVYLWYAETNTVEPVYLPIEQGVISREHIEKTQERDGRLHAFISGLNKDWKVKMNFKINLKEFLNTNKIRKPVQNIVHKSLEV